MSKQRTCKLVTKILNKTCSSLLKMTSDWENNFMQHLCNKWIKYRNVSPNHKNAYMGPSTVHLHGVDLMQFKIDYKKVCLYYIKRINMLLVSVGTLLCKFTRFWHYRHIYQFQCKDVLLYDIKTHQYSMQNIDQCRINFFLSNHL